MKTIFFYKMKYYHKCHVRPFLAHSFIDKNPAIMKTQFFSKMGYDFKGHFMLLRGLKIFLKI